MTTSNITRRDLFTAELISELTYYDYVFYYLFYLLFF